MSPKALVPLAGAKMVLYVPRLNIGMQTNIIHDLFASYVVMWFIVSDERMFLDEKPVFWLCEIQIGLLIEELQVLIAVGKVSLFHHSITFFN